MVLEIAYWESLLSQELRFAMLLLIQCVKIKCTIPKLINITHGKLVKNSKVGQIMSGLVIDCGINNTFIFTIVALN